MAKPAALIVGGTGYFGARLAEALGETHDVTVTYRSTSLIRQVWLDGAGVTALPFDSALQTDFETDTVFDLIVNLAMPGAREAQADASIALDRALATACACAGLLADGRAKRIIHFSTFHIYGDAGAPDYAEDTAANPKHPYGVAHLAVERFFADDPNAEDIAVVRPTNMVGAPAHLDLGDQVNLIFLDLCRQVAQTNRMVLRNDGWSYRDILTFPDAIAAVRSLAETAKLTTHVFNLAAGAAVTLRAIAEEIAESMPGEVEIECGGGSDQHRSGFHVDISRMNAIGWVPTGSFRDEAARTIAAFR